MAKRDILEQARAKMLQQFKAESAPIMDKILKISADELQEAEDASYQLLLDRTLEVAGGVQLDSLGLLLDLRRNGRDDRAYRTALRLKVVINNSGGQASTLIALLKSLVSANGMIEITELFPAGVQVYADELTLPPSAIKRVGDILAATVSLSIVTAEENPFTMDGSLGGGFGSVYDYTIGGRFVKTISDDNPVIVPSATTFLAASGGVDAQGDGRGFLPEKPWATSDYAYTNTPQGWTLGLNEGSYTTTGQLTAPYGYGRSVSSWEPRKAVVVQTASAQSTFLYGTSYLVPERIRNSGFIIDCQDLSNFAVYATSGSQMSELILSDIEFRSPNSGAFRCDRGDGIYTVDSCFFNFPMEKSVVTAANLAATGAAEWNVTNNQFDSLIDNPIHERYISGYRVKTQTPVGTYKCTISGNTFDLGITANTLADFHVVEPLGADLVKIEDNNFSIASSSTYAAYSIDAYGEYNSQLTDLTIAGNSVYSRAENSFGINLGVGGGVNARIATAVVKNNVAIGKYFSGSTPCNFSLLTCKSDHSWSVKDNYSAVSFIGYLVSENPNNTCCVVEDNLAYDCYGPHYFAKGNTDALIQNNRAVHSDTYQRRQYGMLHATSEGAVDNVDTQFLNNTVVIQSAAKGFALAGTSIVSGVSQDATFTGNKYFVPDTLSNTTDLFLIDDVPSNITEWLAVHPNDADDNQGGNGLIFLPQADIDLMVEAAEADVVTAYGSSIPA